MALKLLLVLVAVLAAAADDAPITWSSSRGSSPVSLPCTVTNADRLAPRRPPPPLLADVEPALPFVWWRDGEILNNTERVSTNGALSVPRRRDSEGRYQCGIRHYGGLVLGYPTRLKFASIEKQFSIRPEAPSASIGQPLVLTCEGNSTPPALVSWLKDDHIIAEDSRIYVLSNQLFITNVTPQDAGSYKCIATNTILNKRRSSHAMRVQTEVVGDLDLALVSTNQNAVVATEGSRVVLACPVIGWPRPKLIWEQTLPFGRTQELETETQELVIEALEADHEGIYSCSVEGNSDLIKTFNVSVTSPPVITIPPSSKAVLRASTVRFNCTASGRPPPTITWYKDGRELVVAGRTNLRTSTTDGKRIELVISGVMSSDAGVYQCFAHNSVSTTSAWATLNVTGADTAAPTGVKCWPVGPTTIQVQWQPPKAGQVVAYTVHSTSENKDSDNSLPRLPHNNTNETVTVGTPLTPYSFQVRAYVRAASDMSESAVCQGQGVPIKLSTPTEDTVLVSWKQFADKVGQDSIVQWILQYRKEGGNEERNVTMDGGVLNYTLNVSPAKPLEVRVLGTRTLPWLQQNLTLVPWTSTNTSGQDLDGDMPTPIPYIVNAVQVGTKSFTVFWQLDETNGYPIRGYTFVVCAKAIIGDNVCQNSNGLSAKFDNLQPNTEYEVSVQALKVLGRVIGGPFSPPYVVATQSEGPQRFKGLTGQYINSTSLRVSWDGEPALYTVFYSDQLKLPIERWDSVETRNNTVVIPDLDCTKTTYVMVKGYQPSEHSRILTIQKQEGDESKELQYEYTADGIRVWWPSAGRHVVTYNQNLTHAMEQWISKEVDGNSIELTNLDPNLVTYVMVESKGPNRARKGQSLVLSVPRKPAPVEQDITIYLAVGITMGVVILSLMVFAAVYMWRKRKRARSPVRSRWRNLPTTGGTFLQEGTELKSVGGRLANGARDAGEPLLNGHVHITENPTSKTPNGKTKNRRRNNAFDLTRYEDPDVTLETVLDADTSASTGYDYLDTSRRPEFESKTSEIRTHNSFTKLPDDNMNSELNRSADLQNNSKIQPTLQPNG